MPTVERGTVCVEPSGAAARGAGAQRQGADHRDVSATEQRAIERRTAAALARKRRRRKLADGATVPVYVHVMRDDTGQLGDVTDPQIREQIAVLNETYSGGESSTASDTGFRSRSPGRAPLRQHHLAPTGPARRTAPRPARVARTR